MTAGQLVPRPPAISRGTVCQVSFKLLCRRCHTLQITTAAVAACPLVEDVQRLAKQQYHALARRSNPDTCTTYSGNGRQGLTFRRIASAYAWIMGLPGWQSIDPYYWAPIAEAPLPMALERRSLALGPGWQEWFC